MYLKSWWMDNVSLWAHLIGLYKRIWSYQIRRTSFHSRTHEDISGFSRFRLDRLLTGINHCWVNPSTFNQQRLRFLQTHSGVTPSNNHSSVKIFQKSSNERDGNQAKAYQSWCILGKIFLDFAVLDIDIIMSGYLGIKTQKRLWITFLFYFLTVFLNDKVNIITYNIYNYQSGGFSMGFYPQTSLVAWRQAWSRPAEPQSVP